MAIVCLIPVGHSWKKAVRFPAPGGRHLCFCGLPSVGDHPSGRAIITVLTEQASFDEEYVRKLAAGDPEIQRHFVSHFSALLRIKLRSKLRSPQLIEDVRQETFLRVLQSFKKDHGGLQRPERLGAYVNSVCNNVMFEALRAATRHGQIPEDMRDIIDDSADPARQVVTNERKQIVGRVLESLPAKDRELLRQIYFEERDKAELCREMKVNGEYLRVLVHRAKLRFKDALAKLKNAGIPLETK